MAIDSGTRLGSYQIVTPLGAGGMGEVYRARDVRLGREVALKVLPTEVASDPSRLARFHREAQTLAGLNHPNIVTLFTVEEEDGTPFLTMELVEGQSLDRHIASGGWPAARVIELGIALADALAAAHEKGVVHRDLKPGNVMLTREGRVKILDFGLAKYDTTSAGVDSEAATEAPLSIAGEVRGTVPYMSPEQVRGEVVDSRSDLFALGVLLYELATGRRPFQGATAAVIISAILRDAPVPLSSARSDAPPALDRIIARCLEKEPSARFQTARDLSDELRRVQLATEAGAFLKPPPTPSTPLVGRETALASAAERLRDGARVLSITGYGGVGKTRFAIEIFRRMASEYAGGAAFVSLASVTSAAEVLAAVAVTLEIAQAHGRSALDALCTVIGDRRVLLVLDNLEQVLDSAEDIAALVSRCPSLQVIATSRAPLKIGAESEFALPPLELPASDSDTQSPEALGEFPSIALFVERAARVKPGFALTAENASAITGICRRLDGLPLALELAAARARILEPAVLLQRLDHALDLLTSGDRDLPLRQRTLRATISWSYSLLDAAEQRLLRRVSVFHEGWTLEAMEQVCYEDADRHRALDALDSIVEKGLVRVAGAGDRYSLLETIRAFASEQLHAGGEVEPVRNAHADYFQKLAASLDEAFRGRGQIEAARRARSDNANTLAALHWLSAAASTGDPSALETGLQLCGHMNWFWHIGGLHFTGRDLLDPLLELARDRSSSRGRALARMAAGMISTTTGEWERSLGEWQGAYDDGMAIGDEAITAEAGMGVGYCHLSAGRMEEAGTSLNESMTLSANGVSDFVHALSMTLDGMRLFAMGNLEAGIDRLERARRIQDRIHDYEGGGVALSFLAQMTFAKGDHASSLSLYRDALRAFETVGDRPELARVYSEMGWTALAAADMRTAQDSFRRAVQAAEEVGSPRGTGLALLGLAAVEAAEGREERA
ncbi:MAG TPA: protein kinase, partial [Vicinamibacteria bacterium]|nr:protein kinase [Vicinamibacteria bacterium]